VLLIIALCIAHNVDSMGRDMMHPIQEVYLLRGCMEPLIILNDLIIYLQIHSTDGPCMVVMRMGGSHCNLRRGREIVRFNGLTPDSSNHFFCSM
jgi:hypothetical protein